MTDRPSELEEQLAEALARGAQAAPSAIGLAKAARERARRRRRAAVAGLGVAAVLAIGVPAAVLATGGSGGHRTQPAGPGPSDPVASQSPGYRWESWHGVTVQVPANWVHGSLDDWCADGGDPDTPRVERPGATSELVMCDPAKSYGLSFQEIDNHDDFQWPVVQQAGPEQPAESFTGGRGIGGVLVMVTTRTSTEASYILYSMHAIPATGDDNGCQYRLRPDATEPPEGGLSVCRYDGTGALEQSEALFGEDAGKAVTALQAAPDPGACADTSQGSQPHEVVVMKAAGVSARVDLVAGCPRVTVDGKVRELTSDVVYWALSPGWSGEVPAGVPLPPELRRG